jgi:hypothetical protein
MIVGLLDDVVEENVPHRKPCGLTAYMGEMDKKERAELEQALDDPKLLSSAIHRVLKRRGFTGSEVMVRRHRRGFCGCR